MPGRAVRMVLLAVAAVALGACRPPTVQALSPSEAARAYFDYLRDGQIEQAKRLCFFENERAEKVWVEQIGAYLERREAGQRAWWGTPFREQVLPEKSGPAMMAVIEVQWRYQAAAGWMMGPNHTYRMKDVNGEWRMWISTYDAERGVPFVPGPPKSTDEDEED